MLRDVLSVRKETPRVVDRLAQLGDETLCGFLVGVGPVVDQHGKLCRDVRRRQFRASSSRRPHESRGSGRYRQARWRSPGERGCWRRRLAHRRTRRQGHPARRPAVAAGPLRPQSSARSLLDFRRRPDRVRPRHSCREGGWLELQTAAIPAVQTSAMSPGLWRTRCCRGRCWCGYWRLCLRRGCGRSSCRRWRWRRMCGWRRRRGVGRWAFCVGLNRRSLFFGGWSV